LISRARFLDKDEDRLKRSNAFDNGIVSFAGTRRRRLGDDGATAKYLPRRHRITAKKENDDDDDDDNNTQNSTSDRQNNIKLYTIPYESIFYFLK
jgi:hypothetical protein